MEKLETLAEKNKAKKIEENKIKYPLEIGATSFAEQYLEKPVAYGKYATQNGVSVTFCTFRGVPLLDDY